MARISKATLKNIFKTGSKPTQSNWWDFLDSFVHKDEQAAINSQAFNQRLNQYDADLKATNQNLAVDTLGDVFSVFQGWNPGTKLINAVASAGKPNWSDIQGKPGIKAIQWSEQIITTDGIAFNPTAVAGLNTQTKWLVSEVASMANSGAVIIMDMQIVRRFVGAGVDTGYYVDQVNKLRLAVSPRVNFS